MSPTYKPGLSLLLATYLLAAFLIAFPAGAQEAEKKSSAAVAKDGHAQLLMFAANNGIFDKRVLAEAATIFSHQIDLCPSSDQSVRQLPTTYGRLSFPRRSSQKFPAPYVGLWAEHVKMRGCGQSWLINMLVVGRQGFEPLILTMLPGETRSDPMTQASAERMGALVIKQSDNTCSDDARVRYTRMLGYRQPDGSIGISDAGEGWFEEWTFRFCRATVPVQMAFLPDGSGGYEIKARMVNTNPPKVPESKPALSGDLPSVIPGGIPAGQP